MTRTRGRRVYAELVPERLFTRVTCPEHRVGTSLWRRYNAFGGVISLPYCKHEPEIQHCYEH